MQSEICLFFVCFDNLFNKIYSKLYHTIYVDKCQKIAKQCRIIILKSKTKFWDFDNLGLNFETLLEQLISVL